MKKILLILLITPLFFILTEHVYATTSCDTILEGGSTINTSCSFDNSVDGFDDGTGDVNATSLTIDSGETPCVTAATLTIGVDQTIAVGSISIGCGAIAISTSEGTQKLAIGMPLWMVDADSDGAPSTTTVYAQSTAPTDGVRKAAIDKGLDCCDSDPDAFPGQTQPQNHAMSSPCSGYNYNCDINGDETPTTTAIRNCTQSGCDAYHWTVTSGWDTTIPLCGALSQTYYVVKTAGTCAQTDCSWNTSSLDQTCL